MPPVCLAELALGRRCLAFGGAKRRQWLVSETCQLAARDVGVPCRLGAAAALAAARAQRRQAAARRLLTSASPGSWPGGVQGTRGCPPGPMRGSPEPWPLGASRTTLEVSGSVAHASMSLCGAQRPPRAPQAPWRPRVGRWPAPARLAPRPFGLAGTSDTGCGGPPRFRRLAPAPAAAGSGGGAERRCRCGRRAQLGQAEGLGRLWTGAGEAWKLQQSMDAGAGLDVKCPARVFRRVRQPQQRSRCAPNRRRRGGQAVGSIWDA